jgi:DNA processing protein
VRRAPDEDRDRLRLARTEGVGPMTYRRLLRRFGTASAALAALPEIARKAGRAAPLAVPSPAEVDHECVRMRKAGAQLLFVDTDGYPPLLGQVDDAPPVLAVLGDPAVLHAPSVALVGSRNASANGQRLAEMLAEELAAAGFVVVSGMARGIDAAAHQGAMRSGRTVACVAGGLDMPYPPQHAGLQARIAKDGAVVSEVPLGTAPQARHFPRRNRVIAGLSLGVVVVEAALRSGSLITARLAQEGNREVFAVPGSPLDARARGTNDLLRQGATLVESAQDVIDALPEDKRPGRGASHFPLPFAEPAPEAWPDPPQGEAETARAALLPLLGPAPTSVDDLLRRCHLSAPTVMAALLDLELAGRVEALPGNRFALLSP